MSIVEYLAELVNAQLEGKKPAQIPQGITIEEILDIAHRNHMNYLLLGALLKTDTDKISEEHKEIMRSRVMRSLMRTVAQVTELQDLEKSFEEAGVKNQFMKGARMKFLYPAPELREMSDIDVLIDGECMKIAAQLLAERGYTLSKSIKHHDIYHKAPFMVVEAHKAMYDKTVDEEQYKYFSNFSRAVLREGMRYTYDFSKEDFYIYMMAHMAKHFYAMGCGIRNLVDIYVYREKFGACMNQEYIKDELKKCGILEFTKHMEKLTEIWLKGEKSSMFYEDLFRYMMDSGIYGKDENGIWNKFAEEKMKDKEATPSQLKRWYYFPPVSYMSEHYPWLEEHSYLLPVAWGIRAFRGAFLKKGVQKRKMVHEIESDKVKTYQTIYQNMGLHFKK